MYNRGDSRRRTQSLRLNPRNVLYPSSTPRLVGLLKHWVFLYTVFTILPQVIALEDTTPAHTHPYLLDENSVVLITGIAGALGSELALALHNTYHVQAILGIDSFVGGTLPTSYGWAGDAATKPKQPTFVQFLQEKDPSLKLTNNNNNNNKKGGGEISKLDMKMKKKWILKAKREFQTLDLQRQRVSRLVQTLGRKLFLYKADVRVSLPEYFDLGQIPILDTVFTSHHHYREDEKKKVDHRNNRLMEEEEDDTPIWRGITHIVHLADDKITQLDGKEIDELVRDSNKVLNRTITLEELYDTIIIPRGKEDIRAGIMETIMEQLVKVQRDQQKANKAANTTDSTSVWPVVPHLVYASSYEVYNYLDHQIDASSVTSTTTAASTDPTLSLSNKNTGRLKEDSPISTPSSMRGAAKVLDEMIANLYHTHHGIFSIGLRFFPIYGPWCNADDRIPLFDMAQRAVGILDGQDIRSFSIPILPLQPKDGKKNAVVPELPSTTPLQHVRDFVYIDDAVDAILAAMQYYPSSSTKTATTSKNKSSPSPLVVNVGTGSGSSLLSIAQYMENYFPRSNERASVSSILAREEKTQSDDRSLTVSIASTERAQKILGFKARTSLKDGLLQLLSWHNDRISYFRRQAMSDLSAVVPPISLPNTSTLLQNVTDEKVRALMQSGMHSCSLLDEECLRGRTVFPCVSECADDRFCTPSLYDHVAYISRILTSQCPTILYTVSWDRNLQNILSAVMSASPDSIPYVDPLETMSIELKGVSKKEVKMKSLKNSLGYSCNIAFVPEDSALVQRIKKERGISSAVNVGQELVTTLTQYQRDSSKRTREKLLQNVEQVLLRHGFWTLIPLSIPDQYYSDTFDENALYYNALKLLPKLSPGYFFSSSANRHAIYCDTNVLLPNVDVLVDLLYKPQTSDESIRRLNPGKTVLVVPGAKRPKIRSVDDESTPTALEMMNMENLASQTRLYTMIRSATRGSLFGSGSTDDMVDSKWMVHLLDHGEEDALRFRCDVYEEAFQWNLASDHHALEFIIGLHDLRNKLKYILDDRAIWWETKLRKSMILSGNYVSQPFSKDQDIDNYLMSVSSSKKQSHQSFVRIIPSSYMDIVVIQDY